MIMSFQKAISWLMMVTMFNQAIAFAYHPEKLYETSLEFNALKNKIALSINKMSEKRKENLSYRLYRLMIITANKVDRFEILDNEKKEVNATANEVNTLLSPKTINKGLSQENHQIQFSESLKEESRNTILKNAENYGYVMGLDGRRVPFSKRNFLKNLKPKTPFFDFKDFLSDFLGNHLFVLFILIICFSPAIIGVVLGYYFVGFASTALIAFLLSLVSVGC